MQLLWKFFRTNFVVFFLLLFFFFIKASFYLIAVSRLQHEHFCILYVMCNISYLVQSPEKTKAICSSQRKVKEGSQVQRDRAERSGGGWRMYTKKNLHHHHCSPASGMRQWKIPSVQHSAEMAENRGGGTMTLHIVVWKPKCSLCLPSFFINDHCI